MTERIRPAQLSTSVPRHGTRQGYRKGCRCAECTDAARAYRKLMRDRARAENRPAYQRELESSRRAKERYRGTCKSCGARTTGCFGPGAAPEICFDCTLEARRVDHPHGTRGRYEKGCRCDQCREANTVAHRVYRKSGHFPNAQKVLA